MSFFYLLPFDVIDLRSLGPIVAVYRDGLAKKRDAGHKSIRPETSGGREQNGRYLRSKFDGLRAV